MGSALKYRQTNLPRQNGEQARLKVIQGADYGCVFIITSERAVLGRGDEADVVLSDLKASRTHAEIVHSGGGWSLKDAGSSNGVIHNGRVVRDTPLRAYDTLGIGETVLEFVPADAGTQAMLAPVKSSAQHHSEIVAFEQARAKVKELGKMPSAKIAAAKGGAKSGTNKTLLLLGAVLGAAYVMMSSPQPKKASNGAPANGEARTIASIQPPAGEQPKELSKTAEQFMRAGFREFRERNYLRAKTNFQSVLQIIPNEELARMYVDNCDKAIKDEVDRNLEQGFKEAESGKINAARGHLKAVLRLLSRDPTSPDFVKAQTKLNELEKGSG